MTDDQMAVAIQRIELLQHRCDMEVAHIAELKSQISTLRAALAAVIAERDEARRKLCDIWANEVRHHIPNTEMWPDSNRNASIRVAEEYGWDCFKEATK